MASLTIIMPLYNKEKYIREALDSVFMQETSYDYKIIAADDNSTDGTVNIIKEYQKKYPDKITLLTSETNQKLYKNVLRAYEMTKTDYFCVLDPDDFWIDRYKIQKALNFLEKNKEFTIYVTDTIQQLPDGSRKPFIKRKSIINSTFDDYLKGKAALGCTLGSVFRNVVFKNGLPDKMVNLAFPSNEQSFRGDSFRSALHLHEGKAHCVPYADAVYRVTNDGLWTGSSKLAQQLLTANLYKDLWVFFDKKYPELLALSYNTINSAKPGLIDNLAEIKNEDKIINSLNQLFELNKIFKDNIELINEARIKNLSLKNKVRLSIYKRLSKKLMKKGIV